MQKSRDAMLTRLRKLTLDLPLFVVVRLCTEYALSPSLPPSPLAFSSSVACER